MRHKSMRRSLLVTGLVLALSAMAMTTAMTVGAATKTIRIAYFAPLANTYVQGELRGIAGVLKKEKNVELVKVDTGFDATKQFNAVQDAITQKKFDGFIVLPLDSVGLVSVVQQAIAAGIKVVSADTPLGPSQSMQKPQVKGQSGTVFDPWTMRGVWAGKLIVRACGSKNPCKVGMMASVAALPSEKAMRAEIDKVIKKKPSIQVVSDLDGGAYTGAGGQKVAQDMLTAHRDLDVLHVMGDQPAAGAILSVDAAGLTGKVKIIGGAVSQISKPLILSGKEWGSWAAYPEDEGKFAMEILLKAIRGKLAAPVGLSPAVERVKKGQNPMITKENVASFKPQYAG